MNNLLLWIVFNIPLGKFAPYVLGIALGSIPHKLIENTDDRQNSKKGYVVK